MSEETIISVISAIVVAAWPAVALWNRYFSEAAKMRRAIDAVPLKTIAEVKQGDVVRITGRVRTAGDLLVAPISGRKCVFFEVIVEEPGGSAWGGTTWGASTWGASTWTEFIRERSGSDFLIEDDSGKALVKRPLNKVLLAKKIVRNSGFLKDASPELEELLRRHGYSSTGWIVNKTLACTEGVLVSGETVSVVGQARWEQDPDPRDAGGGYRDTPKRLVLSAPEDGPYLLASEEPSTI